MAIDMADSQEAENGLFRRQTINDGYTKSSTAKNSQRMHLSTDYTIQEKIAPARYYALHWPPALILHCVLWLSWTYYIFLRFNACASMRPALSPGAFRGWLLLLCEIVVLAQEILRAAQQSLMLFLQDAPPTWPMLKLVGSSAPSVHVFVTCCGEAVDIVMDVAIAAAIQDYPSDCYKVFVLDDGKNSAIKQSIDAWNNNAPSAATSIMYLARDKQPGVPHHFKSGNLRFGIETAAALYGVPEFISGLDADMITEPDWLSRTVPHLIRHPELAIVNSPQMFYNVPEDDPLGQDPNAIGHMVEPMLDLFGGSQCQGTGYVIRTKALESIGGWPLVNIAEDAWCSIRMMDVGWKAAFINDEVQFGMVAGCLHSLVLQTIRGCDGILLLGKESRFFLPPVLGGCDSRMLLRQRFYWILRVIMEYNYGSLVIPMLLVPFYLLPAEAWQPSATQLPSRSQFRAVFLVIWMGTKVMRYLTWNKLGAGNMQHQLQVYCWSAPYGAYCAVKSFFADIANIDFTVTGSFTSPVDERSATNRKSLVSRLTAPLVLTTAIYSVLCALCLGYWFLAVAKWKAHGEGAMTWWNSSSRYLYTGITLQMIEVLDGVLVPVRYMIWPPTVPERRELLVQDEHGVWRSRIKTWQKRDGSFFSVKDAVALLIVLVFDWL